MYGNLGVDVDALGVDGTCIVMDNGDPFGCKEAHMEILMTSP